ncbi:hypothetical protein FBU30_000870 [Linnemannia zychae]|nr:hypothetical protein FBU30_000870 [Linnemannia zychae]
MFREGSATLAFKHMNLKRLEGTISCIFPRNTPSLEVWTDGIQILLPTSKIKADIANYCPYLTEYGLRDNDDFIIQFCDFIVDHPTHIRFDFDFISTQVIDALLQHRASLKVISLYASNKKFSYETDNMAEVSAVFRESGHLLQQIPRTCPKLEELDLYLHEMEMKDIEGGEWLCKDLRTLRIRIKGLDTKEKVIKALEMWQNGSRERWRKQAIRPSNKTRKDTKKNAEEKKDGEEHEIIDTSIEARVAHHLLKFEKLKKVWLGYQTWSLL